ncbi:hypothetical protein [uncultured Cyclobacterium sp.]|uniref:hypothetical protein n=1 Tax=uncultured Cyclobacterium sp. TaxID=453820 RepID=UPI0030EE0DC4
MLRHYTLIVDAPRGGIYPVGVKPTRAIDYSTWDSQFREEFAEALLVFKYLSRNVQV